MGKSNYLLRAGQRQEMRALFCRGSWPWSIHRGSVHRQWRKETSHSSSREKSPFYVLGLKWWGHSGKRVRLEKPIPTALPIFLDPGRQKQESSERCVAASLKVGCKIPACWNPLPCVVLSHIEPGLVFLTNRIWQKWRYDTSETRL